LQPFAHPDLVDAFSTVEGADVVNWSDILAGQVFVVDMPLKRWGLGGRVAYLFIKLRFFALVDARQSTVTRDDAPVFFLCDEYQDIVSADRQGGLSDLNFWDKSRSAKLVGVISWQGMASIYAALGDRDVAAAIEQNFRQKLFFRSEDEHTLNHIAHIFGRVEIERVNSSRGTSSGKDQTTRSETSSTTHTEKSLVDAQVVRQLSADEAVAILSIGGRSTDDVIRMRPIYI
jgi:type IV secretory pathway TraG/TraD family ATPase VirD4